MLSLVFCLFFICFLSEFFFHGKAFYFKYTSSVCFLMIAILTDVRWYLLVVLIVISLIISDFEHTLMYLLPICVSFLKKKIIQVFCPFFKWIFGFCYWIVWTIFILLIKYMFYKYFLKLHTVSFHFLYCFFCYVYAF